MRLFLLLLLVFTSVIEAKKAQPLDHLGIAALLIRDGNTDRALAALDQVDRNDEKTDFVRLETLYALAYMKKSDFEKAVEHFDASIARGQTDPMVYIYKAQSYFQMKQFKKTLESFDQAAELGWKEPQYIALRAQAHFELGQKEAALAALEKGLVLFGHHAPFYKQQFFYFTRWGLFEEALEVARRFIAHDEDPAKAYQIAATALHQAKATMHAIGLLQEGKLAFPQNSDIVVMLAHLYVAVHRVHAAADLFDQASILDSKYIKEASELYRRAKKLYRSLYFNAQIVDQAEKHKQRLAILLEFGDFEQAAAMEAAIKRVDLIKDEDIRYALAFTLFQTGQYDKCEEHLSKLTRGDLFAKAVELRKTIQQCKIAPWECY